ncbi:hypothetical protein BHE74_00048219 [Ensete ventricosum]|nr:hypothetical protein GW17_00023503 [Ensete ventricosum]RWW45902.1 hypothetical protein BHE74_00048219 [Ensete ventricosum]RZS25769.1 hypothetical protein BHM03_00059019 [Ensete ventricosum]
MDSSPPPPRFRGYGTRFVLLCVLVPLVLVSLLLLSVDPSGPTHWFSSFSFYPPLHGSGDAHKEKDLESQRGFGAQVSFDRSGHASDASVPLVAAPSPAQGPVYVYEEGEPPLFHDGPCRSIYSSEGRFINSMEMETRYRTRNPDLAHVFFLPFSVAKMVKFIYKPESFDISPIKKTIADYIDVVAERYPYWNRSLGADHFMLSCHDWGPHSSKAVPNLYGNSIRVLCNANTSEGFDPSKDVSLPEINIKTDAMADMMGGQSASHRPILAFFAGGDHGPVRPLLLEAWKDKDHDVQVHEYLPKGVSYYDMMRKSKYCLCPSGYEVASPRIVEAIYLGCVPVTINDHYVLPFSDVLDWKAFSVEVGVEDIPNIKKILMGISPTQYIRLQRRGSMVQRHFVVNSPPRRFDVFHMILHSIWLRRLNVRMRRPQVSG